MASQQQVDPSAPKWSQVIKACFLKRYRPAQVTEALKELWALERPSGVQVVAIILKSGAPSAWIDPLIPMYLEEILRITSIDICDILIALLARSTYALGKSKDTIAPCSDAFVEHVFLPLIRLIAAGERPKTAKEARRALQALEQWLTTCNAYDTVLQMHNEGPRTSEPSLITTFETLGTFAISLLSNSRVKEDLTGSCPKDLRDKLASACNGFATLLTRLSPSQVAPRLQMIARTPPLTHAKPEFTTEEIAFAVTDLPVSNSRIGLYAYLNAALCARPLTDDLTLLNYLHAKYQNDTQSLMMDLIIASFDVLANALQHHQASHHILCYRSFIANKLPTLLLQLSGSLYPPMTVQICIQMALGRVDVHPFPPLSSDNETANNETLKRCRQEFVQSCVLFQFASEQGFNSILGGSSSPAAARGARYVKENLASQCIANVHRAEELSRELEGTTGNAGAISGALVETLRHFCNTKETMSLRTLCNILSRRLQLMDVILQYAHPADLLSPLCDTLNEWTHDEDQSEFQPAYEEFASILLLVLAVIHRYQLSESEIGIVSQESYVPRLLSNMSNSIPASTLDAEQNKHLTKWVQGLYATDEQGETNGISDETMSHCPPQAFYMLVPTLFEQSVQACKLNVLAVNTLKGGLEFLLEPFLLPSLIGGLGWLAKHSWEDHQDYEILLQVLHKLLRPDSISGDAQAMHQTILAIVARPLAKSLQDISRRHPNRKDVEPLIEVLKPHVDSQRSTKCSLSELNEWCTTPGGGIRTAVKNILGGLVRWSSQFATDPLPHKYTHRTIIAALDLLGADEVLAVILDEVTQQTEKGVGSMALEIASAIICAPACILQTAPMMQFDQGTTQGANQRRTLRQALHARSEAPKELVNMPTERVEALIRLVRCVNSQSASPAQMNLPMADLGLHDINITGGDVSMSDSTNLDETAAVAAVANPDFAAAMDPSMDMNAVNDHSTMPMDLTGSFDMNFDLTGSAAQQQQQTQDLGGAFGAQGNQGPQPSTEEDIFAGLDMGDMGSMGDDDFDFN